MSRLPDLVLDSRLHTRFHNSITIHSYREIDDRGRQFFREEHWRLEQLLGRGGFGKVQLERCITEGTKQNSLRAVKIIDKPFNQSKPLDFNRELEAIAKFSNDRYKRWFVKSFGWFDNPGSIFITMEYCCYGDLHHYLIRQHFIPIEEVQQIVYQILEGLDQMHQNDFAHRDLKPGNILIKSIPPEKEWWIVLADFGISKRADESNGPTTVIKGTPGFMAPELLGYLEQVKPKSIADFKAADMWALGEITFQMLTGGETFQNHVERMAYCQGQREFPSNRLPPSAGDDGQEFVAGIMMAFPNDRMNTTESLQHRWMEPLHLREEFATLRLEHTGPLVPEASSNESPSARWSSLSEPEYKSAQTVAKWRPAMPTRFDSSKIRQVQLESTSRSPSIQQYLSTNQELSLSIDIASVQTLESHSDSVSSVAFSPDSARLASGLVDGTIKLWDARSGKCLQTLEGHSSSVLSVAFSPHSARLASGSGDETIKLWDARSGKCLQTLEGHNSFVISVAFSPDSARLASGSFHGIIKLWDARSGKCLQTLEGHSRQVYSVAFSPDSARLASGSGDRTIKLWDARSGKCLQTLEGHSGLVSSVAFSPDSARLASGSFDETIKLWDACRRSTTVEVL